MFHSLKRDSKNCLSRIAEEGDGRIIYNGSVLKMKRDGFSSGALVEITSSLVRIWSVRFPLYHGEELHLSYSDVFWEEEKSNIVPGRDICSIVRSAFESVESMGDHEFMEWTLKGRLDDLQALRCRLFYFLNHRLTDQALLLKANFDEVADEQYSSNWWIDTKRVWSLVLRSPKEAVEEVESRRLAWQAKLRGTSSTTRRTG